MRVHMQIKDMQIASVCGETGGSVCYQRCCLSTSSIIQGAMDQFHQLLIGMRRFVATLQQNAVSRGNRQRRHLLGETTTRH